MCSYCKPVPCALHCSSFYLRLCCHLRPLPPAPAGLLNGASPLLSLLALGHGLCQETSSLWRVSPTCCAIAPCLHTLLGQNDFLLPYSCGSGLLPAAGICPYSPALHQSKLLTDRQLLVLGFCLMFGQHLLRAMLSAVWAVALALELTGPGTADTELALQSATEQWMLGSNSPSGNHGRPLAGSSCSVPRPTLRASPASAHKDLCGLVLQMRELRLRE